MCPLLVIDWNHYCRLILKIVMLVTCRRTTCHVSCSGSISKVEDSKAKSDTNMVPLNIWSFAEGNQICEAIINNYRQGPSTSSSHFNSLSSLPVFLESVTKLFILQIKWRIFSLSDSSHVDNMQFSSNRGRLNHCASGHGIYRIT